jgi:hypothetical protein
MRDLLRRLQLARPRARAWVERTIDDHAAAARPVRVLGFEHLSSCFPRAVMNAARIVAVERLPFPPVAEYGLTELAGMDARSMAAITFGDTIFVRSSRPSEGLVFHELVHLVQWRTLGIDDFLLTYAVGLARHGYAGTPLETIAYRLQEQFEEGRTRSDVSDTVAAAARAARDDVRSLFAESGLDMADAP